MMVEFNPTSTAALMVQPSVLEVSSIGLIPFQACLSIQPTVKVSHHRFYLYDSEIGDSGNSICSSERTNKVFGKHSLRDYSKRIEMLTRGDSHLTLTMNLSQYKTTEIN